MPRCQFQPEPELGFGEDEKSVCPLFLSRWEGVFYCPGKWQGRGAPRPSRTDRDAQQRIPAKRSVMEKNAGFMKALKCRECGREYPLAATHVCEFDFGPLEVAYDYDRIKRSLTRSAIAGRPTSMWR